MTVLRKIFASRKWTAALVTILGLALSDAFGVDLSPETMTAIVALVATIIGAEGIADAAGARASQNAVSLKFDGKRIADAVVERFTLRTGRDGKTDDAR